MYIVGDFDEPKMPPERLQDVEIHRDAIEKMRKRAIEYLNCNSDEGFEVVSFGRAYLLKTTSELLIITEAGWDNLSPLTSDCLKTKAATHGQKILGSSSSSQDGYLTAGGVFVNVDQYLDWDSACAWERKPDE